MMTLVRDRLRAAAMPPLKLVDSAAEFASLEAPPPAARLPAAYVIPLGSRPGPNGLVNATRQRVEETVAVVLLWGNLKDARGGTAAADLLTLRDTVRSKLLGWTPAAGWEPLLLGPAQLIDITEAVLAWQETYTSAVQLRGA